MKTNKKPALIVVDYQDDFASPKGSLYVKGGELIGHNIKQLADVFDLKGREVIFTGDEHTPDHTSFASTHKVQPFSIYNDEMIRPDHCVSETPGAELYNPFKTPQYKKRIKKGYKSDIDSYSGFGGKTLDEKMTLDEYLQSKNITDLYITGLATDYCVGDTALDSVNPSVVKKPYKTTLVTDAIKGVSEETTNKKLEQIKLANIQLLTTEQVINILTNSFAQ